MELKEKIGLVTGSSRGIGRAIAYSLAKNGSNVVINYYKDLEGARETEKMCSDLGVETFVVKADVSSRNDVKSMVNKVVEKFGGIDILINNAGILGKGIKPEEINDDDWDRVIGVNLTGTFFVTQEVIRYMKRGKIVNIASIAGKDGGTVGVHYAASKGGLIALTFNLAKHLAPNIQVNAIAPGPVKTDLIPRDILDNLKSLSLTRDIAKPEEIAHTVIFLLENDHITGEVIDVNGGRLMD